MKLVLFLQLQAHCDLRAFTYHSATGGKAFPVHELLSREIILLPGISACSMPRLQLFHKGTRYV